MSTHYLNEKKQTHALSDKTQASDYSPVVVDTYWCSDTRIIGIM